MKDYLIQFNADGRRGATYAAGVHYYVDDKGNAINGSVNIRKLLNDGYVFVETDDYLNLLGNNADHQEYCLKADGTFAPYVPPEPTAEEKAAANKAQLKTEYEAGKKELLDSLQTAYLSGNTEAVKSIQSEYQEFNAAYKSAVEGE